MADTTLTLTDKQFLQLTRVLTASCAAYEAGIHPLMPKRKGGEESETKAETRHARANDEIHDLLKAAIEPTPEIQTEQELPEPLRTILAGLKEKGIDAKVERVTIQSQPKESE